MSVMSLILIESVHTHCMHAWIMNILSEGVVREDGNATKNGPPSAHQRTAEKISIYLVFEILEHLPYWFYFLMVP